MGRRALNWDRAALVLVLCLFFMYYFTRPSDTLIRRGTSDDASDRHSVLHPKGATPPTTTPIPSPALVWGRAFTPRTEAPAGITAGTVHSHRSPQKSTRTIGGGPSTPTGPTLAPVRVIPDAAAAAANDPQSAAERSVRDGPVTPFKIASADVSTAVRSVVREYAVDRHEDPDVRFAVGNPPHKAAHPTRQQLLDGLYDTIGAVDPIASIPANPANRGAPYVSNVQLAQRQIMARVQRELRGPPKFALEVGSFIGSGIVHCWAPLVALRKGAPTQLLSIDTWQGDVNMRVLPAPFLGTMRYVDGHPSFDETLRHRIRANGQERHVAMLHMPSLLGARFVQARGWQPDFIFIDTAHEIGETFAEISLYFNLLAPGGLLSGDDYVPHSQNAFTGVKHDVDLFAAYYGVEKFIEGVLWYIRKPHNFTNTAAELEARRGNDLDKMMAKMWTAHRDPVRTNPFSRERFHPYRKQWGKAFFTPTLFAVMSLVHYYAPGMGPTPQMSQHGRMPAIQMPHPGFDFRKSESVQALSMVYSRAVSATPQAPSLPTPEVVEKFAPPPFNAAAVETAITTHFGELPGNSRASLRFILQVGVGIGHTTVQLLAPLAQKNQGTLLALDTFHGTVGQRLRMGEKYKGFFELANGIRPTVYGHFLRHVNAAGFANVVVPLAMGTVVGGRLVHSARWLCGVVWLESSGERGETYAELANTTASLAPGGLLMGRLPVGRGAATIAAAKADIEMFLRHRGYPTMEMVHGAEGVWMSVRPMQHETALREEVEGFMTYEA